MPLSYTRNKHASTIDLDNGDVLVRAAIEDTFFAAAIEMTVSVPDLEITSIKGEISRSFHQECQEAIPLLQKVVGVRIGTGLIKAVNSLVGGRTGCPKMADLILECCDQVILRFTLPNIKEFSFKTPEEYSKVQRERLSQNPRLIGSCIVYAKGGPVLKAIGM